MDDYVFKAYLVNSYEYDNGNKETSGVWVSFPTTREAISAAFEKIGLPSDADSGKYFFDSFVCGNDDLRKLFGSNNTVDELNYLASAISDLEDIEMTVFQTALAAGECKSVAEAINLAYNTEFYEVIADIHNFKDLAEYYVEQNNIVLDNSYEFFNWEKYGEKIARENGGRFVDGVYLAKSGAEWKKVYDGTLENIPSEYIVTKYGKEHQKEYNYDNEVKESLELAGALDTHFRDYDILYPTMYPDEDEQLQHLSDCLIDKITVHIKDMLNEIGLDESAELLEKVNDFENRYPDDMYYIYQVKDGAQTRNYRFAPLKEIQKSGLEVSKDNYELKYSHIFIGDTTLESIYEKFNIGGVRDFKGHSMSVSDIVVLKQNGTEKAYYCDSIGFTEVPEFLGQPEITEQSHNETKEAAQDIQPPTMTVLVVEPMQAPKVKEIDTGLKSLQSEVGGNIEVIYPFAEPVGLICNDEGKMNGMQLNRALYDAEGEMYEIIAGTFVLAGLSEDSFESLSPELIDKFSKRFEKAEMFINVNGKIAAIPVRPSIREKLDKLIKERSGKDNKPTPTKKPPSQEL